MNMNKKGNGPDRLAIATLVCALVAAAGAFSLWWGIAQMQALGQETNATAAAVALGGLSVLFGLLFFFIFLRAARIAAAMRRGDDVIAHWTVAPATLDLFRDQEARLAGAGSRNLYPAPKQTPAAGLEVRFNPRGVLIGDHYFPLSAVGMQRITRVAMARGVPGSIAFETRLTGLAGPFAPRLTEHQDRLRIPVAHNADEAARRVLAHFQDALAQAARRGPALFRLWRRILLGGAGVSAVVAIVGFLLRDQNDRLGDLPALLAIVGGVLAVLLPVALALIGAMLRDPDA